MRLLTVLLLAVALPAVAAEEDAVQFARRAADTADFHGGLVVHVGCGRGRLTAVLRLGERWQVHGVDTKPANIAAAREHIRGLGQYGPVAIDIFDGRRLPYVDNLVNLLVAEELGRVSMAEIMRVLCPRGVACVKTRGAWKQVVKPVPAEIDEWTHYLHDPSNNAVAHDTVVAPPRGMQWCGSPRYSRHHDRMSSLSALVSAGGRLFYIFDEAPPFSILVAPEWRLIARDAFNGTILWKRDIGQWHSHMHGLKNGPADLPRRLVATREYVFATLGIDAPVSALDAGAGELVREYEATAGATGIVVSAGTLFARIGSDAVAAVDVASGKRLWLKEGPVEKLTLAADEQHVVFLSGDRIVCLHRGDGALKWESKPVRRAETYPVRSAPTLVLHEDVVLFAASEFAANGNRSWKVDKNDTLVAVSLADGRELWQAPHPLCGYASPEDLFVIDGLVWAGETTSGHAKGTMTGRDLRTGEVKCQFDPDVSSYWFHHRCHRAKATERFLLTSRTGIEFVDFRNQRWHINHWVRGACLYGVMPANGMIYAPQHPCACFPESKLSGLNALSATPAQTGSNALPRLIRGPAYGAGGTPQPGQEDSGAWPTYRHDVGRSGVASTHVPGSLDTTWRAKLGGSVSSPVIAGGLVFVAQADTHTVHALDAATGEARWQFVAGADVDSPPTVYQGLVLFGSNGGHVYCLRASDGALVWRFRAAPADVRHMYFERLTSVWPVHGSVLVHDGVLWILAGRSMFLDGGLRLYRMDPHTGKVLSESVLDDRDPKGDGDLQVYARQLNMPVAMADILSCDGRQVYMRSQAFALDGRRCPPEALPYAGNPERYSVPSTQTPEQAHLFSPTGFLDDTWWHRTYWVYGSRFPGGWAGYPQAGKVAPAAKLLVVDRERVYGFGRLPKYYRWTTPIEHHLFATPKHTPITTRDMRSTSTVVRIANSPTLKCGKTPLTATAWVKPSGNNGVVLARGGRHHGYALLLRGRHPRFAIRLAGVARVATGPKRLPADQWIHLAGVLTDDKQLELYVDGQRVASANAKDFLKANPADSMQIGADEDTTVGDDQASVPFEGAIDEVRVYHRALPPTDIAHLAQAADAARAVVGAALAFTFDNGKAEDVSGNRNHGQIEGAKTVAGKVGKALRFEGPAKGEITIGADGRWMRRLPFFVRAMVLAGDTLFVAGPPDLVDEASVHRKLGDESTQQLLAEQKAAYRGARGAHLWAISSRDGKALATRELPALPSFDGLVAAYGRLYLTTADGSVLCLASAGE